MIFKISLLALRYCSQKFNKHKILCLILYDLFKASNCVRDEGRLKNKKHTDKRHAYTTMSLYNNECLYNNGPFQTYSHKIKKN